MLHPGPELDRRTDAAGSAAAEAAVTPLAERGRNEVSDPSDEDPSLGTLSEDECSGLLLRTRSRAPLRETQSALTDALATALDQETQAEYEQHAGDNPDNHYTAHI